MAIPVFRPSIKRKDMDAVLTCLISDRLGPGTEAEKLVHAILETHDLESGAVLRERTRGLEILLRCLELSAGARVGLSALSPKSHEFAMRNLGLVPVPLDTEEISPVMDGAALHALHLVEPLDALIVEHHLGFNPDFENIASTGIPVIQDISNVLSHEKSTEYAGEYVLAALEPDNIATCGGGVFIGAVHRKGGKKLAQVTNGYPGDIYLPDMNAALGSIQLKELKTFIGQRKELAQLLQRNLMEGKHRTFSIDDQAAPSLLPILLNSPMPDVLQYALKNLVELLPAFDNSVITRLLRDFDESSGNHKSPAEQFPNAASFAMRTVLAPLYPSMGKKEADLLCKVLKTLP